MTELEAAHLEIQRLRYRVAELEHADARMGLRACKAVLNTTLAQLALADDLAKSVAAIFEELDVDLANNIYEELCARAEANLKTYQAARGIK